MMGHDPHEVRDGTALCKGVLHFGILVFLQRVIIHFSWPSYSHVEDKIFSRICE
jgi:hypothetical protein